jgi:hypothetical protein
LNSVRAVENFYSWYIAELQGGNNPIADDSFRERGELSSTLIAAMDQQIAEGVVTDPFVCAENSVGRIDVVEVLTWQPEMRLLIKNNLDNPITLSVVYSNGAWQIDAIICGDHLSPRAVTDDFYGWYVDFTKTQGNPLLDRAYQDSEWLAWSLIQTTNRILEEGIAFDPFLCAQDYPDSFTSTLISSDGRHASVQVTTLPINQTFMVSLIQTGSVWQIDEVVCPIP